jgi:hypothetical protein
MRIKFDNLGSIFMFSLRNLFVDSTKNNFIQGNYFIILALMNWQNKLRCTFFSLGKVLLAGLRLKE